MIDFNPVQIQGRLGAMDDPARKRRLMDESKPYGSSKDKKTGMLTEQTPVASSKRPTVQ